MAWKKYKPNGYYRTCPLCGASLDPGEICDCGVSEYVFSGEEVVPERLPKREARAIIPPVKLPECRIERPDVEPVRIRKSNVVPKHEEAKRVEKSVKESFAKKGRGKWFFNTTT